MSVKVEVWLKNEGKKGLAFPWEEEEPDIIFETQEQPYISEGMYCVPINTDHKCVFRYPLSEIRCVKEIYPKVEGKDNEPQ